MKKRLDVSQPMKDFEGKNIEEAKDPNEPEKKVVLTLKDMLIRYLRSAHAMGLTDQEQNEAYVLGVLIGGAEKEVVFTTSQYDTLKTITDKAKIKQQDGKETAILPLEITGQVKDFVDCAEVVDEKNAGQKPDKEVLPKSK